MTTSVSGTTSTAAATTTASTNDVVKGAAASLLTSLNAGSGIDTTSLVSSLVAAQYATQDATLTAKATSLDAQISAVSTVKNAITTFADALSSLVKGGTLTTQPNSSNASVLGATALPGAKLAGLSSSITVTRLAAAQIAVGTAATDRAAAIGTGTLRLTLGQATIGDDGSMATFTPGAGQPVDIAITAANNSLDGIAAAINAAKTGVTASVVADADGTATLSLKGATGAAQAFTLQPTAGSDAGLSAIAVGPGATNTRIASAAQNARLSVDGVTVERTGNTIDDLVPGVKLQLSGTSTTPVSLTSTTPVSALSGAVSDFVDAYNAVIGILQTQTDPVNGALRTDPAARSLMSSLQAMTLSSLVPGADANTPSTLAALGVATARDGTLSVDATTLSTALAKTPQAVEAMFAYSSNGTSGLSALLSNLSAQATGTSTGLGVSNATYTAQQSDNTDAETKLADDKTAMTTRLTAQFASMQSIISSYKSTQTFLTNQIAAWNKQTG